MENNSLTILKIIILSVIAIVLILILCVLLFGSERSFILFESHDTKYNLIYDGEIDASVSSINVNSKSSDVRVELTDKEKVYVKVYGRDKDRVSVRNDDKELNIEEVTNGICIGFCFNISYRIVVSVPRDMQYDLDVSSISGDISMDSVKTNNLKVKSVSGDITVGDFEKGTFESVSGDVTIGSIKQVKVKTVSGEIEINEILGKADLRTTSGGIEINNYEITQNSKINTVSGDVEIQKNNSYINTSTISGDVDIPNNNRYAEVETSIKTTSGDIDVGK